MTTRAHKTNAHNFLGQTALAVPADTSREMDRARYTPAFDVAGRKVYVRNEMVPAFSAEMRCRSFLGTANLYLTSADGKSIEDGEETGDNRKAIAGEDYPTKVMQAAAKIADARRCYAGTPPAWAADAIARYEDRLNAHRAALRVIAQANPAWWTFGKPSDPFAWIDAAVTKVRRARRAQRQPLAPVVLAWVKSLPKLVAPAAPIGYQRMTLVALAA